jgi:hypothetical protein
LFVTKDDDKARAAPDDNGPLRPARQPAEC